MSAATFSTSSKRSCSYRLLVNPRPVRAMPDSASLHRKRSLAETTLGSSDTEPRLNARQRRQHCSLHLLAAADVDLAAGGVDDVEGVDDFSADGGHLGVEDVEVEVGQRPGDAVQHGDAVGGAHLDEGAARRRLVV